MITATGMPTTVDSLIARKPGELIGIGIGFGAIASSNKY